jgi:hypothetical protein
MGQRPLGCAVVDREREGGRGGFKILDVAMMQAGVRQRAGGAVRIK